MVRVRWLLVGAGLLGVAVVSAAVALNSAGNPGDVFAITATPRPEERAWSFHVKLAPEDPAPRDIVRLAVDTSVADPKAYPPGAISDISYRLQIDEVESAHGPVMALVSNAEVPVDSMLDGAEWEIQAERTGRATVRMRFSYIVTLCETCEPHDVEFGVTTRFIDVQPISGDVNCSGAADSIDAVLVLQFVAQLLGELRCGEAGDVNGDGRVDAADATLVLQYTAGLLKALPP